MAGFAVSAISSSLSLEQLTHISNTSPKAIVALAAYGIPLVALSCAAGLAVKVILRSLEPFSWLAGLLSGSALAPVQLLEGRLAGPLGLLTAAILTYWLEPTLGGAHDMPIAASAPVRIVCAVIVSGCWVICGLFFRAAWKAPKSSPKGAQRQ